MTAAAYDCTVWEHWLSAGAGNATNLDPLGQSVGQNTARCQKSDSLWTKIAIIGVFARDSKQLSHRLCSLQRLYRGFLTAAFSTTPIFRSKRSPKHRFPSFLSILTQKLGIVVLATPETTPKRQLAHITPPSQKAAAPSVLAVALRRHQARGVRCAPTPRARKAASEEAARPGSVCRITAIPPSCPWQAGCRRRRRRTRTGAACRQP